MERGRNNFLPKHLFVLLGGNVWLVVFVPLLLFYALCTVIVSCTVSRKYPLLQNWRGPFKALPINARQAIDEPGHLAVDVYDKTNSIAGLFVLPRSVHKSSFCHCKTHFYAGIDIVKCAFYWMIDFQSRI